MLVSVLLYTVLVSVLLCTTLVSVLLCTVLVSVLLCTVLISALLYTVLVAGLVDPVSDSLEDCVLVVEDEGKGVEVITDVEVPEDVALSLEDEDT